ncbi:MAG TPA: LysR substrate-binding domain-containing protein, partial [Afifellaceae bacterium]|nr:LysR substrate-binding domain-containing protein [Afifellaceae bacterium]
MNESERLPINSDLLRTFLAVEQARNLTRAAAALGRTQSAISIQIRKLEEGLCVRLFERQARGMALTEDGERLLPAARNALAGMERIGDLFSGPLTGRIRVGIPDDYGISVLERVLANFASRHPGVEVSVRCGFSVGFPKAIRRNELDLAVYTAGPPETGESAGKPLFSEPMVWAANADFKLRPDRPVPLALFDRQCWWRDAAIGALHEAGRAYRIAYSSESVAGVKAAIGAGLAVGVLNAGTLEATMRVVDRADGFPPLPTSSLVLLQSELAD